MRTCLIVPCYLRNRLDNLMLNRLIISARKQTRELDSIIVVDDASPYTPDGDYEDIDYIRLRTNSGPAFARNQGIRLALERRYSHLLFTDHDCILSENWAHWMSEFLIENSLEAAGGLTLAAGSTIIDRFHNANGTLNGRLILPEREYLLYAPTCNFAISRRVAEEFVFDVKYSKAAGEDVDYCLRIGKKYPIGFCRKALVWHDFGYGNSFTGISKLLGMFKKYKEANRLLFQTHPELFKHFGFGSEPISARDLQCPI